MRKYFIRNTLLMVTTFTTSFHVFAGPQFNGGPGITCDFVTESKTAYRIELVPVGHSYAQIRISQPRYKGESAPSDHVIGAEVTQGQTGEGDLISFSGIPSRGNPEQYFLMVLVNEPRVLTAQGEQLPLNYVRGELGDVGFSGTEALECYERKVTIDEDEYTSLQIIASSEQIYARFEEDRSNVLNKLRSLVDEAALEQCAKLGFETAERISNYQTVEKNHGGFAYLSTIEMNASYDCK